LHHDALKKIGTTDGEFELKGVFQKKTLSVSDYRKIGED